MYGANQSLCRLIIELREHYNVKPIVLIPNIGTICKFLDQNEITYYVKHYYWWVNDNKGILQYFLNWRKQFNNRLQIKELVMLVKSHNIDLVYSNSVTINIGTFVSRKLNCPHIWHLRESMQSYGFKFSTGRFLSELFLKRANGRYILISFYLKRCYESILPKNSTSVIYNGIDISKTLPFKKSTTGFINLCMTGIISEQKNNLDALKALNILVHVRKINNIRLHLIGGHNADYLQTCSNFIQKYQLADFVKFYGYIEDIESLISSMDIGLMCSHDEAFGRVTIEYMIHGLPVIASNSGANPELVKEGIVGFLYEIYNPEDLADKIASFISNPTIIRTIGQSARTYAIENFSSQKNTSEIYKVICEVLENNMDKRITKDKNASLMQFSPLLNIF